MTRLKKEGMEKFLFPDGVPVVSIIGGSELKEGAYIVHRNFKCGEMSPDESKAAIKLCSDAEKVVAGSMSVEDFMNAHYPEEEDHGNTYQYFIEKKIVKKRKDGSLTMNIIFID